MGISPYRHTVKFDSLTPAHDFFNTMPSSIPSATFSLSVLSLCFFRNYDDNDVWCKMVYWPAYIWKLSRAQKLSFNMRTDWRETELIWFLPPRFIPYLTIAMTCLHWTVKWTEGHCRPGRPGLAGEVTGTIWSISVATPCLHYGALRDGSWQNSPYGANKNDQEDKLRNIKTSGMKLLVCGRDTNNITISYKSIYK